ncbi:Gluconate kinase [Nitrospira sp. KM1]|uniref:gluconokinase n=1 Tax=Nitrospira sp. KM1 TaxID=1936990 RepID=UPI0013A7259C|nr:gluconokinase [Nitrospira sp. KM1]BCA54609.1 Gluconate kinase [Nitrospira sp. KM1]
MALKPQVIILIGVSGSGKTTIGFRLSRVLGWEFQDADDLHSADNLDKLTRGRALTDEDRRLWLKAIRQVIIGWVKQGRNGVLACSALKAGYRKTMIEGAADHVRFIYLKGDFALIEKRLALRRGHFMNRNLLASQFETLEEPVDAVTVDADHTPDEIVAHIRSNLSL